MTVYDFAALNEDMARLRAELPQIKMAYEEAFWIDVVAGIADPIQERAEVAGLGPDAFLAINAMLIEHGLLDPSYRIT